MKNLKDLTDGGYEDYFNSYDDELSESFEEKSGHFSEKKMKRGKKGKIDWDSEYDRKKSSDRAKKIARKEKQNLKKNF